MRIRHKNSNIDLEQAEMLYKQIMICFQNSYSSLTEIFNMSIDSNRFPFDWKTARFIPLFKNDQRSVLDNYRPISILPVVSKIMERLFFVQPNIRLFY